MIVPFSAQPVFDGTQETSFEITLTGDAAPVLRNMTPGVLYGFTIGQDAAGGHLFTWPSSVTNATEVSTAPLARTSQIFLALSDGILHAVRTGGINP